MSYGRINFQGNADNQDREPRLATERRFDFSRRQPETPIKAQAHTCPKCNLSRTAREFAGLDETFLHCQVCRDRGASRETVKAKRAGSSW